MLTKNFPGRKMAKKKEAEQRAAVRANRTAKQQLERLDQMFGKGVGAKKERERLARQG